MVHYYEMVRVDQHNPANAPRALGSKATPIKSEQIVTAKKKVEDNADKAIVNIRKPYTRSALPVNETVINSEADTKFNAINNELDRMRPTTPEEEAELATPTVNPEQIEDDAEVDTITNTSVVDDDDGYDRII